MKSELNEAFSGLSATMLKTLADCLETGRLAQPFSGHAIRRLVSVPDADQLANELASLTSTGMRPEHIAYVARALGRERESDGQSGNVELICTGPDSPGSQSRDTSVVVRELFARAERTILLAGFAVTHGRYIFRELGARMDQLPQLRVRMFLNVAAASDGRSEAEALREFADTFASQHWPGRRLPTLLYDPRALRHPGNPSVALHAKCVVIDGLDVLITSANFTAAGHERNIEIGVLIRNSALASALSGHFDLLVESGVLRRLPGS